MKQRTAFHEEMRRDLMRVYREVCANYSCRDNTEALEKVINHPAPRFYINVKSAHTILSPMMHGDRTMLQKMTPQKRQMYEDLFDTVLRLSQKDRFHNCTLHHILRFAIQEPAPKFYIQLRRMEQIWKEETLRIKERNRRTMI